MHMRMRQAGVPEQSSARCPLSLLQKPPGGPTVDWCQKVGPAAAQPSGSGVHICGLQAAGRRSGSSLLPNTTLLTWLLCIVLPSAGVPEHSGPQVLRTQGLLRPPVKGKCRAERAVPGCLALGWPTIMTPPACSSCLGRPSVTACATSWRKGMHTTLPPAAASVQGIATIVGPLTALLALVFAYRTGYIQLLFRALSAVLFTSRPAAASKDSSKETKGSKAGGKKGHSKRRQAQASSESEAEEREREQERIQQGSASQGAAQPSKTKWPPSAEEPPSDAIAAVRLASESGGQVGPSSEGGSRWPANWQLPRQGSGSFGRARASLAAAVQQAHAVLASLQNLVTNPLAGPEAEQAHQPLPVRVAMPAAYPGAQAAAAGSPAPTAAWAALPHTSPAVPYGSPSPAAVPLLAPAQAAATSPQPAVVQMQAAAPSPIPAAVPMPLVPGTGALPAGTLAPQITSSAVGTMYLAPAAAAPAVVPSPLAIAPSQAVAGQPPGWRGADAAAAGSMAAPSSPVQPVSGPVQPPTSAFVVPAVASPAVPAPALAQPLMLPQPVPAGASAASARAALEAQLRQVQMQRQQLRERMQQQQQQQQPQQQPQQPQ